MARLGIVVIGQAPRAFVEDMFRAGLPAGTETTLVGCLDGMSDAEVDALTPRDGADTLYTRLGARLGGERDVKISKAAVVARSPDALARLREAGADAIVFACTGEFPPMPGDAGVVFPSRVLTGLAAGLLPQGRLGLLVPAPEQVGKLSAKWERPGVEIVAESLLPSADAREAAAVGERLGALKPDLIAMDCMSYTPDTKAAIRAAAGVPTILAVSATARVLQELLS